MATAQAGGGLTAATLAALLTRLGPDAERAGSAYEHLWRALACFFACRGAATPEDCAEETLDRLARRLDEGVAVDDLLHFARGIARLVLLEHRRRSGSRGIPLDEAGYVRSGPEAEDEIPPECLARCLGALAPESRDVILEYYGGEGRSRIDGRKRMARRMGISECALRSRAQRLRDRLARCVALCLATWGA
jgi:DNA-directed RNA polymerase specialized sigma24 family protein